MSKISPFKEDLNRVNIFPACHWIKKEEKKLKQRNSLAPCKRWGHSSVVHENQMF
jgi:hypothetical protein